MSVFGDFSWIFLIKIDWLCSCPLSSALNYCWSIFPLCFLWRIWFVIWDAHEPPVWWVWLIKFLLHAAELSCSECKMKQQYISPFSFSPSFPSWKHWLSRFTTHSCCTGYSANRLWAQRNPEKWHQSRCWKEDGQICLKCKSLDQSVFAYTQDKRNLDPRCEKCAFTGYY